MPDPGNPYTNKVGFEEEAVEDIITITYRPVEAEFEEDGDEIIKLHETEQSIYQEKGADETIILRPEEGGLLTAENILKDLGIDLEI